MDESNHAAVCIYFTQPHLCSGDCSCLGGRRKKLEYFEFCLDSWRAETTNLVDEELELPPEFLLLINFPLEKPYQRNINVEHEFGGRKPTLFNLIRLFQQEYRMIYLLEKILATPKEWVIERKCETCSTVFEDHVRAATPTQDLPVCVICREEGDVAPIKIMRCGHPFHHACLNTWFSKNKRCPLCRANIIQCTHCDGNQIIEEIQVGAVAPYVNEHSIWIPTDGPFRIFGFHLEQICVRGIVLHHIFNTVSLNFVLLNNF